jgi:hypothetical protein
MTDRGKTVYPPPPSGSGGIIKKKLESAIQYLQVQVKTDFITYSSWLMRTLKVSRLPAVATLAGSEFHSRIVLG